MTSTPPANRPVFDPAEWAILCAATRAVYAGDTTRFGEALAGLGRVTRYADRSVAYVRFALRYQSAKKLNKRPTQQELRVFAAESDDRYTRYVRPEGATFIDILETVWGFRSGQPAARGNDLVVLGCIALAALLEDPVADIDAIERAMRAWVDEEYDDLAAVFEDLDADK
ncbi:MAG TPA: hypothetical protein VHC43_06170 [Mycobacteriales bacterium]|nr:hypothetical protein [Mycobacteriales bacterium]